MAILHVAVAHRLESSISGLLESSRGYFCADSPSPPVLVGGYNFFLVTLAGSYLADCPAGTLLFFGYPSGALSCPCSCTVVDYRTDGRRVGQD
mgnify:FL=1